MDRACHPHCRSKDPRARYCTKLGRALRIFASRGVGCSTRSVKGELRLGAPFPYSLARMATERLNSVSSIASPRDTANGKLHDRT